MTISRVENACKPLILLGLQKNIKIISTHAMTKLNNDRPVSMEVMINLCKVFHCDIGDLMEVIEED